MDKTAQLSRPWFHRLPHPRSPAARTFDWSSEDHPHPDAPAARYFDWTSSVLPQPDSRSGRGYFWQTGADEAVNSEVEDLKRTRPLVEKVLDELSRKLRDALPDDSLRIIYDRRIDRLKTTYEFTKSMKATGNEPIHLLQHQQRQIDWIHCQLLGTLTRGYENAVRPILSEFHSLQAQANGGDRGTLLRKSQVLAERYYKQATNSILEHVAEAERSGKQQQLIYRWRARMLECASAGQGAINESQVEAPAARPRGPGKSSRETRLKTWIAFQLIDENGDPVPNAAYKVTLTDGSIMSGSLDDQGLVRFDDIDPGECQVSFLEIDAREWK